MSLNHEANSSSLAGQLDQDNRSPTHVDLSDDCGAPSEKKVAVDASSGDSSFEISNNGKVHSFEFQLLLINIWCNLIGKENLDAGEICDASKSGISVDFARNLVEQQLKLRRKGITKEKKNATKSPTRSSKRHSIKPEDYQNSTLMFLKFR